jgi:hypothetical protein
MESEFELGYPGNVKEEFRELWRQAQERRLTEEVAAAASTIDSKLRTEPRTFGDPCYPLNSSEQDVFMRGVPPLIVYYAVHRTLNIVVVKSIKWNV